MDPANISELAQLFRDHGDQVLAGEIKFSVSGQMMRALNDSFSLIAGEDNDKSRATPPGRKSRDFIVTTGTEGKSKVFLDLQLIYDFIQILTHLHITQLVTDDDLEGVVDLCNFRHLQKLEIQKLPLHKLVSLRRLRTQLRELSCQQCLRSCHEILGQCGGDRCAEQVWTELRILNLAYNNLELVDNSVRWCPWVHTLNLSHNRLCTEALAALKCLPNLKCLDLSFNRLQTIPQLAADASRKLQTLRLHANSIHDISEVVNFEALTELDLSANGILFEQNLIPISTLASLRVLDLLHNPLAFLPKHRLAVVRCLHSNTSTVKFILNGTPMTKAEKKLTGGFPSYHNVRRQCEMSQNVSSVSLLSSGSGGGGTGGGESSERVRDPLTDSVKKRSRVREIILDAEEEEEEDNKDDEHNQPVVVSRSRRSSKKRAESTVNSTGSVNTGSASNSLGPSTEAAADHLETKKQIEELRNKFGSDWLNADGDNIVKEVFPSAREEDALRSKIFMDELNDDSVLSSTPKEGMSSRLEITEQHLDTTMEPYGTASERTVTTGTTTTGEAETEGTITTAGYESALSREEVSDLTGIEFFQSQQSVEEDEVAEPNEVEYLVERLQGPREEGGGKFVVVLSDLSIKEKDAQTRKTLNRWSLTVMESCERPSERNVISINFKTMRSDKMQRYYLMADEKECAKLISCLREILEKRDWEEFNQVVYRCAKCTTQFCIDKHNHKAAERVKCPECKSFYVMEMTEANQVSNNNNNKLKNPSVQKVQSLEQEDKRVTIVKSTSHSSIGSAASLNDSSSCSKLSNPPESSVDSNESVAGSSTSQRDKDTDLMHARRLGMDSDVEILSNPSQSSIEVLNSCSKNSSRKPSSEERRNLRIGPSGALVLDTAANKSSSVDPHPHHQPHDIDVGDTAEEEQVLDSSNIVVANKLLGNCQLQALTESSSSGSITESICTQYEPQQPVEEHKAVEVTANPMQVDEGEDEEHAVGFKKSNSMFLEGFISASNMLKTLSQAPKAADGIRVGRAEPFLFPPGNPQRADHRLQLYLHQNVFLEAGEKFGSVLRGGWVNVTQGGGGGRVEDALVVQSSRMLYLFVVTSAEMADDDPGQWLRLMQRVSIADWVAVRLLPFGMGIRFCFTAPPAAVDGWEVLLRDAEQATVYGTVVVRDGCGKRWDEEMCEEHRRKLRKALGMGVEEEEGEEGEQLLTVTPFRALTKIVSEVAQSVPGRCALVVTSKRFAILDGSWTWLATGRPTDVPKVRAQLSLLDMVECEVKAGSAETELVLNFMDEQVDKHELWCVQFETRHQAQQVLAAIKTPWERAFNEPFVAK